MEAWIIFLLVAFGTPVAGLATAAVVRWRLRRSIKHQVQAAPLLRVGDLQPGPQRVAVQGVARAEATLDAPIAGVPVIGYRVTIEYDEPGGRQESGQHRLIDKSRIAEFQVEDDTGTVRVRGALTVVAACPHVMDSGEVSVALTGGPLQQMVFEEGLTTNDLVAARNLRATERLLRPDGPVYVCGRPTTEVDASGAESGYRQPPTRVVLESPKDGPLVAADCHRHQLLARIKERLG